MASASDSDPDGLRMKSLQINVTQVSDGEVQGPPEAYKNNSCPRGSILITNYRKFSNEIEHHERKGSEADLKNLNDLFSQMGYHVHEIQDMSRDETLKTLQSFGEDTIHNDVDSMAVIVMSHGKSDKFCTSDGKYVKSREVYEIFSNDNCPALRKKPKLFIFNHCREGETDYHKNLNESPQIDQKRKDCSVSDTILLYSTEDGYVSYRDEKYGCPYIMEICRAFMEYACKCEVHDLNKKVEEGLKQYSMEQKQKCEYLQIHKDLNFYFNPKSTDYNKAQEKKHTEIQYHTDNLHIDGQRNRWRIDGTSEKALTKEHGCVLLINNLDGGTSEMEKLIPLFKNIGYTNVMGPFLNVNYRDLKKHINEFKEEKHGGSAFIVFYGNGFSDFIVSSDNYVIHIKELQKEFNDINCPNLSSKPKMFITNLSFFEGDIESGDKENLQSYSKDLKEGSESHMFFLNVEMEGIRREYGCPPQTYYPLTEALSQVLIENKSPTKVMEIMRSVSKKLDKLQGDIKKDYICELRDVRFPSDFMINPIKPQENLTSFYDQDREKGAKPHQQIPEKEQECKSSPKKRYESTADSKKETELQKKWKLPSPEPPDDPEMDDVQEDKDIDVVDSGLLETDAQLYRIRERNFNGSEKNHSLLKMPSKIPASIVSENKSSRMANLREQRTLNIFMGDVSNSMKDYWPKVVEGWNNHVAPKLIGQTMVYTYGNLVNFKRTTKEITQEDFDCDSSNNLTGATITILEEIYMCKEKYINVFIVFAGDHNVTNFKPAKVIEKMRPADGKIVDVYVLGCGSHFPVKYSLDIRSQLHSGSPSLPHLFLAKKYGENSDVVQQYKDISSYLEGGRSSITVEVGVPGSTLPKTEPQKVFHLGQYIYFDQEPETLNEVTLKFCENDHGIIQLTPQDITVDTLLEEVFRQWNGVIIQLKNRKENIPHDILDFMERLYNSSLFYQKKATGNLGNSIKDRLSNKDLFSYDITFRTLVNSVKFLLTKKQFQSEIEFAENVLYTTVFTSKCAVKNLQLKGHTDADFKNDVIEFRKVFQKCKRSLASLKAEGDCCRITQTSTLTDLQSEDFTQLLDLKKYAFLKEFTMSGIPVYAPLHNSAQINPWTYSIRKILTSPYDILSQVAMEGIAKSNPTSVGQVNKKVKIQQDSESPTFNAIIPVFPPSIAHHLKPIMHTRLYAMCCTFAILKASHIIDFNAHMAGLGVTWARILFENPNQPRSEYIQKQIQCIEATAINYLDLHSFARYRDILKNNPDQAIMTESTRKVGGETLKCESLIKPMFILYLEKLAGRIVEKSEIRRILELILIEYIGRCLSNVDKREIEPLSPHTPYCDIFFENIADGEQMKCFQKQKSEILKTEIINKKENVLKEFYYTKECEKAAKVIAKDKMNLFSNQLIPNLTNKVSIDKFDRLRKIASCGDISWKTLKTFAKEVGLADDDIQNLFNDQNVFRYIAHALEYRNSRERLKNPLKDCILYENEVKQKVQAETSKRFFRELLKSIENEMLTAWKSEYDQAHKDIVEPMNKSQIIKEAIIYGISVNEENFDEIYKRFRPNVGLLSNACQSKKCPWYLKPNKSYNQHSFAERQADTRFPHGLHIATQKYQNSNVDEITKVILSGDCTKPKKDRKHDPKLENVDAAKSLKYDISDLRDKYLQFSDI